MLPEDRPKEPDSLARAGLGKLVKISSTERSLEPGALKSSNPIRQLLQTETELTLGKIKSPSHKDGWGGLPSHWRQCEWLGTNVPHVWRPPQMPLADWKGANCASMSHPGQESQGTGTGYGS